MPTKSSSAYAHKQAFVCCNRTAVLPIWNLMRWHFHKYAFRPLLSPFTSAAAENPLASDCHTHSFTFAHLISKLLLLVKYTKASIIVAPCNDCISEKKKTKNLILLSKCYHLTFAELKGWLLRFSLNGE